MLDKSKEQPSAAAETDQGVTRREFTLFSAAFGLSALRIPQLIVPERSRPAIPCGVASGDVSGDSAIIWSKTDRPARMWVEYSTTDSFTDPRVVRGPVAVPEQDYTAKVLLRELPLGQRIVYRVSFEDLSASGVRSSYVEGSFNTPAAERRNIRIAWSGDTAGQGFGINPDFGGMRMYETMRRKEPQLFVHCGDTIYADQPIEAEKKLDDGSVWRNIVTEAKSKVAESLPEFRGNYCYNLLDENLRRFQASVPVVAQWDDHEVHNNWYPGEILEDDRYKERSASLLAARARQAFLEYQPIAPDRIDSERIYRTVRYGPSLDIFVLDMRSYRGANGPNSQSHYGPEVALLGQEQLDWLKRALINSEATWKVIASDMPLGLMISGADGKFENISNGAGPVRGREHELANLLQFLKAAQIDNVLWVTADVHYAAAHYYSPEKAVFTEFEPFWEFVAGPLHAGTYGPNELDPTFGPEVKYQSVKAGMKPSRPPTEGMQYFGTLDIDGKSEVLTTSLFDIEGKLLYSLPLVPKRR